MSELVRDELAEMLNRPANFLNEDAPGSPIVISSRIRLARNLKNFAFPTACSSESAAEVARLITMAVKQCRRTSGSMLQLEIDNLNELERAILLERHLVSRELLAGQKSPQAHISADGTVSIMVNEEDHLRMQVVLPGMQLHEAWRKLNNLDDKISKQLDIAYDSKLGYLTSCPSNVGTGIRISVMLHLPALTMLDNIKPLERGLAKLGLTVRGMYGEGSENLGNFYQISNQSTLGESEKDIMEHLAGVIEQVINYEDNARRKLLDSHRNRLLDKVGRAFGTLRYSYILSAKEAFDSLSGVRLGVDMDMFNSLDIKCINELFMAVAAGHLQCRAGCLLAENERDVFRAQCVRERIKQASSS